MGSEARLAGGRPLVLAPRRRATREVGIGDVVVGGDRPIAVQSMTTTKTSDAGATARQVAELARAGCDIVRVTVPSGKDADALPEIRRLLAAEGVSVPLVADIHFTPRLALRVVEHVEKVRVNPGNFSDKRSLAGGEYDDARWDEDVVRAYEAFAPLADRARELGVALRIGVNHGSLSDRMVYRYGDSPAGMVESALEFVRFAEDRGHEGLVVSMKASIPHVMVRAYRLLAERLDAEGRPLPLHLGVTEAGGGDEGRMKSAAGMATLLADGLGDTIRVSLTENPVHEVPVARDLVRLFGRGAGGAEPEHDLLERRDPLDPLRRPASTIDLGGVAFGGDEAPRVEVALAAGSAGAVPALVAARPPVELVDVVLAGPDDAPAALELLASLPPSGGPARGVTMAIGTWLGAEEHGGRGAGLSRLATAADRLALVVDDAGDVGRVEPGAAHALAFLLATDGPVDAQELARIRGFARAVAGHGPRTLAGLAPGRRADVIRATRALAACLDEAGSRAPLVLADRRGADDDPRLGTTGRIAAMLVDGLGDAVRLEAAAGGDPRAAVRLAHGILQAAGRRLEKAEFIACPSCGRTLFELEETTQRVRELTEHLKLKIAVMGCIVNGPGEMADADFGYVGWGEGKVALFVGRELVEKDVPSAEAPERLVALIRERGRWTDPEEPAPEG